MQHKGIAGDTLIATFLYGISMIMSLAFLPLVVLFLTIPSSLVAAMVAGRLARHEPFIAAAAAYWAVTTAVVADVFVTYVRH